MCHNFFGLEIIEKNSFFHFEGPLKIFLTPKTLFGLRNPNFGGVILLKLFDLSTGLGVRNYQNSNFWAKSALDISKTAAQLRIKSFREMTPHKVGFLKSNMVFGVIDGQIAIFWDNQP